MVSAESAGLASWAAAPLARLQIAVAVRSVLTRRKSAFFVLDLNEIDISGPPGVRPSWRTRNNERCASTAATKKLLTRFIPQK
jgi:hypothetical protein